MGKLFKGMMALFDWLLMDPNVQINGIIFIEDMTGFNLKHSMTIYNTENTKKMMSLFQVVLDRDIYSHEPNVRKQTLSCAGADPEGSLAV